MILYTLTHRKDILDNNEWDYEHVTIIRQTSITQLEQIIEEIDNDMYYEYYVSIDNDCDKFGDSWQQCLIEFIGE